MTLVVQNTKFAICGFRLLFPVRQFTLLPKILFLLQILAGLCDDELIHSNKVDYLMQGSLMSLVMF